MKATDPSTKFKKEKSVLRSASERQLVQLMKECDMKPYHKSYIDQMIDSDLRYEINQCLLLLKAIPFTKKELDQTL